MIREGLFKNTFGINAFEPEEVVIKGSKIYKEKFHCKNCSKIFCTKGYLKQHINDVHENPERFMCKKCGRKFNVKLTWQNHQKKTHVKDHPKAYKCQRCDYSTDIKHL